MEGFRKREKRGVRRLEERAEVRCRVFPWYVRVGGEGRGSFVPLLTAGWDVGKDKVWRGGTSDAVRARDKLIGSLLHVRCMGDPWIRLDSLTAEASLTAHAA